jgi:glycosyltransferase involved in cell wall biosynthesis
MPGARRVTVIAHELRGFHPSGGMGTATAFLALALARLGHSVEILLGKHAPGSIDPEWANVYRDAGVEIRPVPELDQPVEPWHFAHAHRVMLGLRVDPPEVVIAHDFGAPAYSALRLRQAGVAFDETLFVVFCHGTRRYVADLSPSVPIGDLDTVLGVGLLEQAAVELADVVVSPSTYLLGWMKERGWQLPGRTLVVPYFTRSTATGEQPAARERPHSETLERFAFFGRVDARKGIALLAAALNAIEPAQLEGLELELVGKTTGTWTPERVEALLSESTKRALRSVSFESGLDQRQALDRIGRPGTLVVMPSLQENSPNAVYECLEEGIPFIASKVGGVSELIAPSDRKRVLFTATAEGVEAAIRRVLVDRKIPTPARAAFDRDESAAGWADVVEMQPEGTAVAGDADEHVDVVVVRGGSQEALLRCVRALEEQTHPNVEVFVAETRGSGLDQGASPYVVILDEDDVPHADLVQTLLAVCRATGADVATCGLGLEHKLHFFAGEARGLGAISNAYGNVALFRRAVLRDLKDAPHGVRDPDWPLLASLAMNGAVIVSVPLALVQRRAEPGSAQDDPAGALEAAKELEQRLPDPLRGAARIAAGLAADGS